MTTPTPTEIPLLVSDPAVLAANFAVCEYGPGPDIVPEHVIAVVSYLATNGHDGVTLAALVGRAYAILVQEFGKVVH